jgi:hypothetical protein
MLGKHTLNPNEKTELKVNYATAGRPGSFHKKVLLSTNIPGQEKIEIFAIRGEVLETPAAKISVNPRRIILEGSEQSTGKKQVLAVTNEGALPLIITGIRSRDGKTVYFDGAKDGDITIESGQTKTMEIQVESGKGEKPEREYIFIKSNARNAGEAGFILIVQYGAR